MFKRELKINLKSFIIWTSILIGIFLIVYLMYPSIMSSSSMNNIDEMMEMFPQDLLKAFNMDLASLDSAFGWLKTEGFVFILLITGMYSSILGSNILLKEENDYTIEYLNSLPVKRNNIIFSKLLCGLLYIFIMIIILGIFNYLGLCLSGEFDKKAFLLLSVTPLFSSLIIYTVCLFISTFTNKTRKTLGISLGLVFVSYFLQIISEMSTKTEFLKYFSIFSLANVRDVLLNNKLNIIVILLSLLLLIIFIIGTVIRYNKKELV